MREEPNVLSDQPPRLSGGLRRLKIAFSELVNEYNYDPLTTALQHKILGYCIIFYAEKKDQECPWSRFYERNFTPLFARQSEEHKFPITKRFKILNNIHKISTSGGLW